MKKRILLVEGVGQLRTEPDQAVVYCSLSVFDPSYRTANTELQRLVNLLRETLEPLGFKRTDLKSRSFDVRREADRQPNEYHPRFVGFKAVAGLELRLPLDRELLNRVVEAFQESGANPDLEIVFSASDPEALRARVLAAAVENARDRAEVMARAAGVKLGPVLEINYGPLSLLPSASPGMASAPSMVLDQTEEFVAEDKVRVTWELLE